MIELKCGGGCKVDDEGNFHLGDKCKEKNCLECQSLANGMHPFGDKRLKVNIS